VFGGCLEVDYVPSGLRNYNGPTYGLNRHGFSMFCWFGFENYGCLRYSVVIPVWLPEGLVLIPTIAAWRLDSLARRRARFGHCITCGYDRHDLPATSVCPECGAVPAVPRPAKT